MIPRLIAHRGANRLAPENSRSAFEAALTYPIDGLELDVQLTRDGIPIIYHDRTLFKITGQRKRAWDYSFKELASYGWGQWYSPRFAEEKILTLRDVLRDFAHRTQLLIEIKSRKQSQKHGISKKLVQAVVNELSHADIGDHADQIFILSFDLEVIRKARSQSPHFTYALNLEWNIRGGPTTPNSFMKWKPDDMTDIDAVCVRLHDASHALVDHIHRANKQLWLYSCNLGRQVHQAMQFNPDVIMTDRPDWLPRFLGR